MLIPEANPVLQLHQVTIAYRQGARWLEAVRDISLTIDAGETVGLVGESGSGKSTLALAIMRYLGPNGRVEQGEIIFAGQDLLALPPADLRAIWGRAVNLVPQDPLSALNPSIKIGEQMGELLRHHLDLGPADAQARVLEQLRLVHLADPERVADSYPHQLSGGMQQRVMIGMALSTEPQLLVMDEPTTALDVTTQAAILDLVRELIAGRHTAVLYVTHNWGVVAQVCDRVAVLYAGELVESAPTETLYHHPLHPYTYGLLASVPQLGQRKGDAPLSGIAGAIPPLGERPTGCVFAPRCPVALPLCHAERPALETVSAGRQVRCHRWREIMAGELRPGAGEETTESVEDTEERGGVSIGRGVEEGTTENTEDTENRLVLQLEEVQVHFPLRRSVVELLQGATPRVVRAVDGVTLSLERGRTLGLVGESGSGKTTLARAIVGLNPLSSGQMELLTFPLRANLSQRTREMLQQVQYVFQNPEEALNPYLTVGETLRRPLQTLLGLSHRAAQEQVHHLLEAVRLPATYAHRLPHQLSGGEKQRVAIARAFASNPDLLIGDEAVSALDVSVQASILNLLSDLQAAYGSAILFISHDLAVVSYLADVVAVMYLGEVMELGAAETMLTPPHHPYTEALLSAIPNPDPTVSRPRILLTGEVPSAVRKPAGCPFHPRCPRVVGEICRTETPPWQTDEQGKRIFCHIPLAQLTAQQNPPPPAASG